MLTHVLLPCLIWCFRFPRLNANIITIIIILWSCFTKLKTVYFGRDEHCKTPVFGIGGSGAGGCVGSFQLIDIGSKRWRWDYGKRAPENTLP